jgi:predicted sugar kinase
MGRIKYNDMPLVRARNEAFEKKRKAKEYLQHVKSEEYEDFSECVMRDFLVDIIEKDLKAIYKEVNQYNQQQKKNLALKNKNYEK